MQSLKLITKFIIDSVTDKSGFYVHASIRRKSKQPLVSNFCIILVSAEHVICPLLSPIRGR